MFDAVRITYSRLSFLYYGLTIFPSRGQGLDTQRRGGGPSEPVGEDTELEWAMVTREGMLGVRLGGPSRECPPALAVLLFVMWYLNFALNV